MDKNAENGQFVEKCIQIGDAKWRWDQPISLGFALVASHWDLPWSRSIGISLGRVPLVFHAFLGRISGYFMRWRPKFDDFRANFWVFHALETEN